MIIDYYKFIDKKNLFDSHSKQTKYFVLVQIRNKTFIKLKIIYV